MVLQHLQLLELVAQIIIHAMLVTLLTLVQVLQVLHSQSPPQQFLSFHVFQLQPDSVMLHLHHHWETLQLQLLHLLLILEDMNQPQLILRKNISTGQSRLSHISRPRYLSKIRFTLTSSCKLISILTWLASSLTSMLKVLYGTNMIAPTLLSLTVEAFRQITETISCAEDTVSQ